MPELTTREQKIDASVNRDSSPDTERRGTLLVHRQRQSDETAPDLPGPTYPELVKTTAKDLAADPDYVRLEGFEVAAWNAKRKNDEFLKDKYKNACDLDSDTSDPEEIALRKYFNSRVIHMDLADQKMLDVCENNYKTEQRICSAYIAGYCSAAGVGKDEIYVVRALNTSKPHTYEMQSSSAIVATMLR